MPAPLSMRLRWQIVGMARSGTPMRTIAERLRTTRKTVSSILRRFRNTNDVAPGKSTGRPRISTVREDRRLYTMARRDRRASASTLRNEWQRTLNHPVSRETVNRRLVQRGYRARRPIKVPRLTIRHKVLRLQWARDHQHLTVQHWQHVIFADESRFLLYRVDGRIRVRRLAGERLHEACVQETLIGGGGSVHVWGAFHSGAKSDLVVLRANVTGVRYRDLMRHDLLPWARNEFRNNFRYQHDNAPAHTARVVRDFMDQEGVLMLSQPSCSPDANPIEHLWDALGRAVTSRDPQPTNLAQLEQFLAEEWARLPIITLRNLVHSMPRRLAAMIDSRGGHTRY